MNFKQIAKSVAFASALVASTGALAATDGLVGGTSSGNLGVSLTIASRVQITGLEDIAFGTWGGTGDLVGASAFCVYRNGTGVYNLTVSSPNADASGFRATDTTNFIGYSVRVDDDADASVGGTTVASGMPVNALAGHGTALDCGNADNAALEVTFTQADLEAAPTGTFTDIITLLVEPS